MALGDEQIDRFTANLDAVLKSRIEQFAQVADDKIDKIRLLVNGIKLSFEAQDVKKAEPVNQ